MIAWRQFDFGACYGFDVAYGLPVIAHVYRSSGEDGFGWDLTVGTSSFHPGTIVGGDVDSVTEGQMAAEWAFAGWVKEQNARLEAERQVTDRWIAAGYPTDTQS
jgi:hypothetical protein